MDITLIFTMHNDAGICNSDALYKLIELVRPEVIFEELSERNFMKSYIESTLVTLETTTIKRYLASHDIAHIPIDTYNRPENYDEEVDHMFDKAFSSAGRQAFDLRNLMNTKRSLIERYGFSFLNNIQNDETHKQIQDLVEEILKIKNDERLFGIYNLNKDVIEMRENQMLKNIYEYSRQHPYKRALFFIGSGHRHSMLKKIEGLINVEELKLNWRLFKDLKDWQ